MNNTVLIWIALPLLLGLALVTIQRFRRLSTILATIIPLLLAGSALLFSGGLNLQIIGRVFTLSDSFQVFGRTIQITADQLRILALLYFLCFLWNLISGMFDVGRWFNSLSLVITALWGAVQFISPFLYSAVVIELIALISTPLLSPRGTPARNGVIRFLSMQTLALPLILLSGWMVSGIETSPSAESLVLRGSLLVIAGFSLWAGIFPVHSWLPMLTEETHPWIITFLQTIMQIGLAFFFLAFLNHFAWLRNLDGLTQVLKWIGSLCVVSAGVMLVFQRKLSRVLGYIYLAGTGYIVLAMASTQQGPLELISMMLLPLTFSYWSLGFTFSALRQALDSEILDYDELVGLVWRYPRISILLVACLLNSFGLPLFSLFPSRRIILGIVATESLPIRLFISVGILGMVLMLLRLLSVILQPPPDVGQDKVESPLLVLPVALILLLMLVGGLFPQFFSAPLNGLLVSFQNLLK